MPATERCCFVTAPMARMARRRVALGRDVATLRLVIHDPVVPTRPRRGLVSAGIVALGVLSTVTAWSLNEHSAERSARAASVRAVQAADVAAESDFDRTGEIVSAVAGFVMSSEEVGRDEFERFIGRFLDGHPEIRSLQLLDHVAGTDRSAFEQRLRAMGVAGITEADPDGTTRAAPERDQYLVTWFDSSEMRVGLGVSGLDVLGAGGAPQDRGLVDALVERNLDDPGVIQMVPGPDGSLDSVRLLYPVFDVGLPLTTASDRRAAFVGAAAAVVSPERVFAQVSAPVSRSTDLALSPAGGSSAVGDGHRVLVGRVDGRIAQPGSSEHAELASTQRAAGSSVASATVVVGDRKMQITGSPRDGAAAALAEPARRWILLLGALLTVVGVGGYLWWSRIRRLERFARALEEANEALAASATEMQALAERDHLTGLPNRQRMRDMVEAAMNRPGALDTSVVLVDLDRFKEVNDSIGHRRGDQLLVMVAERLTRSVRTGTLGRVGGDEFCVLLAGEGPDAAAVVAQRLVAALRRPFRVSDRSVSLTATATVCSAPSDASSATELMEHLDVALHSRKARSGDTWVAYDHSMAAHQERRRSIETELRYAVVGNGTPVLTHFQPKVDVRSGRIVSCEGLARWSHPVFGAVSPEEFIDVAEETGLIVNIGEDQISRAVELLERCRSEGLELASVSVNVSAQQFADERLVEHLRNQLGAADLPAGSLVLEITESEAIEQGDHSAISRRMRALAAMGVGLSIDDFGTGYSSMSRIEQMPVDEVKVDQSFVAGLPASRVSVGIIRAILSMAHTLGLRVVAEGVETESQRDWLIEEG